MTASNKVSKASGRRQGVQSIEVGSRLLSSLINSKGPMHLRELSATADMSPSKARRYLISLLHCELVEQDHATGRYDLGAMALRLGLSALNRCNAIRIATEALLDLHQKVDKTLLLSIWSEAGPTIIAWYDSSEILVCNLDVGSTLPLLRSATGHISLSYLPRAMTQNLVQQELVKRQKAGASTDLDIEKLVAKTRAERFARTHEELLPGLSACAAPIFDHEGRLSAVMAMLDLPGMAREGTLSAAEHALQKQADQVSRRLGFHSCEPGASLAEWLESKAIQQDREGDFSMEPPVPKS